MNVLVLPGSLRASAVTTGIAATALAATGLGITARLADDLGALPLFNEDLDTERPPAPVAALRERVTEADALLVVSPSNNGSMSAALKNAIDWLSRPRDRAPLWGKPVAFLVAAYRADSVESHVDHVLAAAGARVVRSTGQALALRLLGGRKPADVPEVHDAVNAALIALRDTVAPAREAS